MKILPELHLSDKFMETEGKIIVRACFNRLLLILKLKLTDRFLVNLMPFLEIMYNEKVNKGEKMMTAPRGNCESSAPANPSHSYSKASLKVKGIFSKFTQQLTKTLCPVRSPMYLHVFE